MPSVDRNARREEAFEVVTARIAAIDVLWEELLQRHRAADAVCVRDLAGDQVLGATAWFGTTWAAGASVDDLIARLNTLSSINLAVLITTDPGLVKRSLTANPKTVHERWERWEHLAQPAQLALAAGSPALLGSLNGLPARASPPTGSMSAPGSTRSTPNPPGSTPKSSVWTGRERDGSRVMPRPTKIAKEHEALEADRTYLQRTVDGKNQLYLYDRENARIVEMF